MSYNTSIFAISETYNLAEKTCQIKDAIISRNFIIIRTTNINIAEEENTAVPLNSSRPSGIKSMPVQKREMANINISGEKYMLEHPVFINFYHNTNVVNLCHGAIGRPLHTGANILQDIVSELALIKHFASNKWTQFCYEIYNLNFSTVPNPTNSSPIPNIKLIIDDIVKCGIFETDYIDKLNASKKYVNRNTPLHNLYNQYRPKYDSHLREIQKKQSDTDALQNARDDLKAAKAANAELQQEIQRIKNEHVMLKAIEEEEFKTMVTAEIKKIWEAIALMQYKASSNF
jgi:hypothetical protein